MSKNSTPSTRFWVMTAYRQPTATDFPIEVWREGNLQPMILDEWWPAWNVPAQYTHWKPVKRSKVPKALKGRKAA